MANDDLDQATGTGDRPVSADAGAARGDAAAGRADAGAGPAAAEASPPVQGPQPWPPEQERETGHDRSAIPRQQLYGQQPPFSSRAPLAPGPTDQPLPTRAPGGDPDARLGPHGSWNAFGQAGAPRPGTEPGPPSAPEPADAPGQPADPDLYGPPDPYGAADPYGPADAYGPADIYGPADPYGPPEAYGQADPYGPDTYGPADAYGPAGTHGPADAYGPAGTHGSADAYGPAGTYGPADIDGLADAHSPAEHFGRGGRPELAEPARPGEPHRPGVAYPVDAHRQAAAYPGDAEPTESLTPEYLLPGGRRAPAPGWRRVVYQATGGLMRVPSSAAELRRREMIGRVRTPVTGGHHRVAVLSLKGGVGKTTTTVGLGSTLASLRGDRVIAVDANPDRGTLSDKIGLETAATVRDLLNEQRRIRRYADVRAFTSQAASRLEVLASDRDPTISVAFSDADYCEVAAVLEHYYSICLTDCGTGLLHSAMAGVLRLADQIVLVSSPSVDGARSASATLDWLAAHSYGDLVRNAVVVLSVVRPRSRSTVDLTRLEEHFAARCRAVTRIPYDSHLEEGAEVELDQLNRATADAYLALAAIIGDGLAWPRSAAAARA